MDKNFNYWQLAPKLDGSEHFNIKMMKFVAIDNHMVRMVLDHVLGTESSPIRNSEWGNLAGTFIRSSRQQAIENKIPEVQGFRKFNV